MVEFEEQPKVYEDSEDGRQLLIRWLKQDLDDQRTQGIKEEELTLNIGFRDNLFKQVEINFDFNLRSIILQLTNTKIETDEESNFICHYKVNCYAVDFKEQADFIKITFTNDAVFYRAKFTNDAYFSFATFKKEANFTKATFTQKADFMKANFQNKVDFISAKFQKGAVFILANFTNIASFYEANFTNIADFSEANFQNKASFLKAKIEKTLNFDNIKLSNESYISFSSINYDTNKKEFTKPHENSNIEIVNTVINGRIDFTNVGIKKINFEGSTVMINGVLNRINFEADCANWETASFLKHEELKKNNIIKALEYKAIEKDEYQKYIKDRRKEIKLEIKKLKQSASTKETKKEKKKLKTQKNTYWWEARSIFLSKWSNNHGQNWGQAILFTILSGLICFTIFYAPNPFIKLFDPDAVQTTWKGFFSSLFMYYIPVDFSSLKDYLGRNDLQEWLKACGVAVYIIGKIIISYGYVEVVQAFRKLK